MTYQVTVLHINRPMVKQLVADLPSISPYKYEDQLGAFLSSQSTYDDSTLSEIVKVEYKFTDGWLIVTKTDDNPQHTVAPYPFVVTILDLDDAEVAGTYGPYTDEDQANDMAEVLLSGHQDDDPHTSYESRVTPVYPEGGRG